MGIRLYPFNHVPAQSIAIHKVINRAEGDVGIITQPGTIHCGKNKSDDENRDQKTLTVSLNHHSTTPKLRNSLHSSLGYGKMNSSISGVDRGRIFASAGYAVCAILL